MPEICILRQMTAPTGTSGMVTEVIKDLVAQSGQNNMIVCVAIGPMIMMKFVCLTDTEELGIPTIVSMNPIMVDGTGMCGACRCDCRR